MRKPTDPDAAQQGQAVGVVTKTSGENLERLGRLDSCDRLAHDVAPKVRAPVRPASSLYRDLGNRSAVDAMVSESSAAPVHRDSHHHTESLIPSQRLFPSRNRLSTAASRHALRLGSVAGGGAAARGAG